MEKMNNYNNIEEVPTALNNSKKESNVLRSMIGGAVLAGAVMVPVPSEAQSYNTQPSQEKEDATWKAEVKRSNNELFKADIEKINKDLKSKYPEASFEYNSTQKCLKSFGGDVFYKGVMLGHVENNCGSGGAVLASGQAMKMLDDILSRIGGTMVIKTTPEVEEKLKSLKVNINGIKVQVFENRNGKIVWSNFEFDINSKSVTIVNSQKHSKGISMIIKNNDGTTDTIEIYPDAAGIANIIEGL